MRWLTLILVTVVGCAHRVAPVDAYRAGAYQEALEEQKILAAEQSPDQALEQVRLASMARALGDDVLAEKALRAAVAEMTSFEADGEWAAIIGAEQSKDWKGEPYEKVTAYLDLGVLLFASGDNGNALAMFKSAILADTGTREQRYRSDFVPAWVMQALVFQAEGETDNAHQAMGRAVDSRWSRATIGLLTRALRDVGVEGDLQATNCARGVLLSAFSGGVAAAPRDPQEAARAVTSIASTLLIEQKDLPRKERLAALQGCSKRDLDGAGEVLPGLVERWRAKADQIPPEAMARMEAFHARMEALLAEAPNVILLVERGRGPYKYRDGRYGEIMRIDAGRAPKGPPVVRIDGVDGAPVWLDSLTYQATTRGGRKVDGFLKGKAAFKDVSLITGYVLLEVAEAAAYAENDQLATAAAVVGLATFIAGVATNPAADVRTWELVPEEWLLVTSRQEPGDHEIIVDGRRRTIRVPPKGVLVATVPALPPGGADVLGSK